MEETPVDQGSGQREHWALVSLCLAALMTSIDASIVNVALPSIRGDLGFSGNSLVWVVNAYVLSFATFQLLGGRLGDLAGHRRTFLLGIAMFATASLGCGLARSQGMLLCSRAIQGMGAAAVSPSVGALFLTLFTTPHARAKAMGISGFVNTGMGSLALLLGGMLTRFFDWHWIFLINIPVSIAACAIGFVVLPKDTAQSTSWNLDIAGVVTVTVSLVLALYSISYSPTSAEIPVQTSHLLAISAVLLLIFIRIEAKANSPLIPLSLLRLRTFAVALSGSVLFALAMATWGFVATNYLQLVRNYTALQVGLAFLPASQIAAVFVLGFSGRTIERFGIKQTLIVGLLISSVGLSLFSVIPVKGEFVIDLLPGMLLVGLGAGVTSAPFLLAAMAGVPKNELGIASGVFSTVSMMGSAIGLTVLVALQTARTETLLARGVSAVDALNGGYHQAFATSAALVALSALVGMTLLHLRESELAPQGSSGSSVGSIGAAKE